ncbi:MAG: hypothetical protein Q4C98_03240 [Capnocytophaga sp.]|nr:hypothetical protein [Capnocytophaga sp.]
MLLLLLVAGATLVSCSKEDDSSNGKTEITVFLKDTDGTPLSEWVVYAYRESAWNNQSAIGAKKSATDTEGKVVFSLDDTDVGTATNISEEIYRFVVYYTVSKTNVFGNQIPLGTFQKVSTITVKEGENRTIELNLDGTANNNGGNNNGGDIVKQPADIVVVLTDTEGNPLSNATVVVGGITQKTDINGKTEAFKGETNSTYEWKATTACGETKIGRLTTGNRGLEYTINTFTAEKGTLVLTNNSDNPYTVTIGNKSWVINGNSTMNLTIALNTTYKVYYKQNSGYLVYPTTGDRTVKADCKSRTVAATFPTYKF